MSEDIRKMIDKVKNFKQVVNEEYVDKDGNLKDLPQSDINEILKGYIECALWTEQERLEDDVTMDIDDEDMDEVEKLIQLKDKFDKKSFTSFVSEDIDIDSRIDAYNDIKTFIKNAGDKAIQEAIDENGLFKLGMDIWFTRNGHGAGFFDHNYENEDLLINAGKNLKSKDLYVGDDGKLRFM
jgi:hypothetical protein